MRVRRWVGLLAAAGLALAGTAEATHQVSHRYVVLGYLRDGAGRPVPGTEVSVTREKTGLVYQERTGPDGFYVVIVHLHDEDLFDRLEVRVGKAAIRLEARFNPLDVSAERGTRVDFSGDRAAERQEMFAQTLEQYLRRRPRPLRSRRAEEKPPARDSGAWPAPWPGSPARPGVEAAHRPVNGPYIGLG